MIKNSDKKDIVNFVDRESQNIVVNDIGEIKKYYYNLMSHKKYYVAEIIKYLLYIISRHKTIRKDVVNKATKTFEEIVFEVDITSNVMNI